jgi:YHS domain-containing protein
MNTQYFKILSILILTWLISCNSSTSEIYQVNNYAIDGYDVVAFHTHQKPIKGNKEFSFHWKDANWLFVNQTNLDKFIKEPERYAPQYGGYCAYGMSQGYKASTEADTWTILDHKLYFNYNQDVKKKWNLDQEGYIEKADDYWPNIKLSK